MSRPAGRIVDSPRKTIKVNLSVYNRAGLQQVTQLRPFLKPDDTLMVVSGNVDKPLDLAWVGESLAFLERFPARVLVATAGLAHLERLAEARLGLGGLVYIYEPNFANVPEFSWKFSATLENLGSAADLARSYGQQLAFKPTGRPLAQAYLQKHGWHYGAFAERVDTLLVQTQTYCHGGRFAEAVAKLGLECAAHLGKTYTQITLDPTARNGVPPEGAAACAQTAAKHGFAGVTAWWSPRFADRAVQFLQLRQDFGTF